MNRYLKALNTDADEINGNIQSSILENYKQRLFDNNFSQDRIHKMVNNLSETIIRLEKSGVEKNDTKCTFWYNHNTLCFIPILVDMTQIENEQFNGLLIMHKNYEKRINIVIDIEKLTLWEALKRSNKASFSNIVDGIRLWTTLPYRIDNIFIITKNNNTINQIINLFISKKLKERINVSSSWDIVYKSYTICSDNNNNIINSN